MPAHAASGFRRILCAVDFSEYSRTALRYAAAVARHGDGQVAALFVNDPFLVAAAAASHERRTLAETTRRQLHDFVRSAVGSEHSVHAATALGDPAREIRKAAIRTRADLIVIGTRGLGGARRLFFGSTASRVLRTTDCAVLAVPPLARSGRYPGPTWPGELLAAIELGKRAAPDARRARGVARWFNAATQFVTVVPPTQTPAWLHLDARWREHDRVVDARRALGRAAAGLGWSRVAIRVLSGDPAEQIVTSAVDAAVGLIVVTLRSSDRLFGTRQGSVTYRVLSYAATPVLALPERQRREP